MRTSSTLALIAVMAAAVGLALGLAVGCNGGKTDGGETETVTEAAGPPAPGNTDTLYLAHARFTYETDENGKLKPVPAPAKLTLLRGTGDEWTTEILEDEESNVFHKALVLQLDEPVLLTIGANGARLKTWKKVDGAWQGTTRWAPTFGGKQERLRDVEVGDVTGDGRPDVVIATHDMGVVAVAEIPADGGDWIIHEVDRTEERTFVHEVEIGDVDGDGVAEFFVTPSAPNVLDGSAQPGHIVGFRKSDDGFERFQVAGFIGAHVKEILVADLEGRGRADLYAAIEPERKKTETGVTVEDPLIIRRYRFDGDQILEEDIATFRDEQCRFLIGGDLTGDGNLELVASTMTSGVWMLRQGEVGWMVELVDKDSDNHEYEHATNIIDLDNDGRSELYVVSDSLPPLPGMVRRYKFNGEDFDREEILPLDKDHMTFNITSGKLN